MSRVLASTLALGAALALAGHGTALNDPTLPLLIVVAWWARQRGRTAGVVSAAGAMVVVLAALVAAGGPVGALVAQVVIAAAALGVTAWLVPAPAATALGVAARMTAADESLSYRALAETLPHIVWMSAADGQLEYLNQRGLAYAGVSLAEAMRGGFRAAVHPDDLGECIDRWRQSLATGAPFEIRYRIRRAADGQERWHLGRALPVRGDDGQIVRWFGTCTDVHDWRENPGAGHGVFE